MTGSKEDNAVAKLETVKAYVKGWKQADMVDWPEGTLGADAEARHNLWLAGLQDILDKED